MSVRHNYAGRLCQKWQRTFQSNPNVTINVLHQSLTKMKEEGIQFAPRLHLQLDNTVKDNKSKYVMAYLQSLVDCGVFEEITVHFFQVGHTHCDIDQLFSRIAIYLKVSLALYVHLLLSNI